MRLIMLISAPNSKRLIDVRDVVLDRAEIDPERDADLASGSAGKEETRHLLFAWARRGKRSIIVPAKLGAKNVVDLIQMVAPRADGV